MKLFIFILLQFSLTGIILSQNPIDRVLEEIEKNNTTLAALKKQKEAGMLLNKTGIYLQNPEFDYAWFAGSPADMGNKTGVSLRQPFDFPTTYIHRGRIAQARNEQLMPEYEQHRSELLLEARLLCLEIVFLNALMQEYEIRLQNAQLFTEAYTRMLQEGETNVMELNKAKLNHLNLQKEAGDIRIRREAIQNELTGMNGGIPVILEQNDFIENQGLIADFDLWYNQAENNNPDLEWLRQEEEISNKEIQLQKARNFPGFNVGYVSELLTHEQFRGFVIGVSIPLWENKNTVKYARARNQALISSQENQSTRYYHFFKANHARAVALQEMAEQYSSLLESINNTELIYQAWEAGEISLTEYLLELTFYYQSMDKILETELELHKTIAVLNKYL